MPNALGGQSACSTRVFARQRERKSMEGRLRKRTGLIVVLAVMAAASGLLLLLAGPLRAQTAPNISFVPSVLKGETSGSPT